MRGDARRAGTALWITEKASLVDEERRTNLLRIGLVRPSWHFLDRRTDVCLDINERRHKDLDVSRER